MTEGTSNEEAATTEPSRRSFLNKLWIGLGLVALAEVVAVVFAFLRSNKSCLLYTSDAADERVRV